MRQYLLFVALIEEVLVIQTGIRQTSDGGDLFHFSLLTR